MSGAIIAEISPISPAAGADLRVGDEVLRINGRTPVDIIEYQQFIDGAKVELVVRRDQVSEHVVTIEKSEGEPLGLSIDSAVFDRIRTCDNHCTFCFIYQLPKGMRRSLYVKDDDFRLSFLYGNYTTLTRFTEFDLERVIDEKLSPLYVSIHTTDPLVRADMLRNPRGATSLRWLSALLEAGIEVHGQVVVCPGVNDADVLERTLQDILSLYPQLITLALVPLGVSDFTTETTMRAPSRDDARAVIDLAQSYHALSLELTGRGIIYCSDEFYLIAEYPLPPATYYQGFDEAENGIGMIAAFRDSFRTRRAMARLGTGFFQSVDGAPALEYRAARGGRAALPEGEGTTILTGEYAAPLLRELLVDVGMDQISVLPVKNRYFGGNIKVAGLLTGADLRDTLSDLPNDRVYLIPDVCLNEGRFLDGLTLDDLPANVATVETSGSALRDVLETLTRIQVAS